MRKILPIIFISSFIGFIVLSFFVSNVSSNALKKRKELDLIKNQEKRIPDLAQEVSSKSEEIDLLMKAFPAKKDFVSVISLVDTMAVSSNVLVDFHFESENVEKDENGDTIIPVTLTITGDYVNTIAFLKLLSTSNYFFMFKSIEGDSPDGIKGKNKITVTANLYAATQ